MTPEWIIANYENYIKDGCNNIEKDLLDLAKSQKTEIEKKDKLIEIADKMIESLKAENKKLKAEIEKLTVNMNAFGLGMKIEAEKVEKAQAEIERLKDEADMADGYADALEAKAKSEAIKEFAERLHDNFISKVQKYYCRVNSEHSYKFLEGYLVDDVLSNIDNLVKEMVGDDNA